MSGPFLAKSENVNVIVLTCCVTAIRGAGHAVYSESLAGDLEGILKQELFMFFFYHNLMFFKVYL